MMFRSRRGHEHHRGRGRRHHGGLAQNFNPTRELIGDSFLTKVKFVFSVSYSGMTTMSQRVLRLNSMLDVDVTTAGNQVPIGVAGYTGFYQSYRVYACRVNIIACGTSTTNPNTAAIIAIGAGSDATTTYTSPLEAASDGEYTSRVIQSGSLARMTRYFTIADVFGVNKQTVRDDAAYGAVLTSNPSNTAFMYLLLASLDLLTPVDVDVRVTMEFYVSFYDRVVGAPTTLAALMAAVPRETIPDAPRESATDSEAPELVK